MKILPSAYVSWAVVQIPRPDDIEHWKYHVDPTNSKEIPIDSRTGRLCG